MSTPKTPKTSKSTKKKQLVSSKPKKPLSVPSPKKQGKLVKTPKMYPSPRSKAVVFSMPEGGSMSGKQRSQLIAAAEEVIPITSGSAYEKVWALNTDNPLCQIFDISVLDHAMSCPGDFITASHPCPAGLKGYFLWACLQSARDSGSLNMATNADNFAFAPFPKDAFLPNSVFVALQYTKPYTEENVKGQIRFTLDVLPTGDNYAVGAGTGLMCTSTITQLSVSINSFVDLTTNDYVYDSAGGALALTLLSIQQNWRLYSDIVSRRGFCRKFGELLPYAPDGSAYTTTRTSYTDMISSPFGRVRHDLGQVFCNSAVPVSYDNTNSSMTTTYAMDQTPFYDGNGVVTLSSYVYSRNCFVWFANRQKHYNHEYVPTYNGRPMKTFIAVAKRANLFGFRDLQNEFLKIWQKSDNSTLTTAEVFAFYYLTELALRARLQGSTPQLLGSGPLVSSKFRDQQAMAFPDTKSIRVPALFADYISCLGCWLIDGVPYYHKFFFYDTASKYGWLNVSSQAAVDNSTLAYNWCYPMINISSTINFQFNQGTPTWDAAYLAANPNACYFPQRFLSDIIDGYYGSFSGEGVSDILFLPEVRTTAAGWCAQSVIELNLKSTSNYILATGLVITYRTQRYGLASRHPLVGSELLRALLFAYLATDQAGLIYGGHRKNIPSPTTHATLLKELFQQTVQIGGSLQLQIAKEREKSGNDKLTHVGVMGEIVRKKGYDSRSIVDRIMAEASSILGQVGENVLDSVIEVGKEVIPILSQEGLRYVQKAIVNGLGYAVMFA